MIPSPSQIKDRLPPTWDAFFAGFGRFTEIQELAIEPLLEGKNCILVSATASGKTEAALAPLLEHYKQRPQPALQGPALLYIVPTRALARDLERRLWRPLERLAVRMQVKTGDEPRLHPARPPQLLITTPESFDSLLANSIRFAGLSPLGFFVSPGGWLWFFGLSWVAAAVVRIIFDRPNTGVGGRTNRA